MRIASVALVSIAGSIATAQPSVPVAPVPTAVVPAGNDLRGNPFLAPGPFPLTVQATKLDLLADPNGGVLDGTNSNYVRQDGVPLGMPMSGATNEGDMDINMSLNPILLDINEPRAAFAFPNTNWDPILGEQIRFNVATGGEPTYGWAATTGAGVLWAQIADNGRDNVGFTAFGEPTGTLYAHAQSATNTFRGGPGYNMLTGTYGNGNGSIYISMHALGFATEYNIDVALAWFPFQDGWVAGSTTGATSGGVSWVTTTAPDPATGVDVAWPSRGAELPDDASQIVTLAGNGNAQGTIGFAATDLDITPANAMLFVQSGDDTNDAAIPGLVESGDLWNFAFRRDAYSPDFADEAEFAGANRALVSFIAMPYSTTNLQGGKVNAAGTYTNAAADNTTSISRVATGTYELTVAGSAAEEGMLMLQSLRSQPGNPADPDRNILSYEYDAARNVYVIESRILERDNNGNVFLEAYPLIDSPFYVAYVDFQNPPTASQIACLADITGDGVLNFNDTIAFLGLFNTQDAAADLNDDGLINFNDFIAFLNAFNAGCP